MPGSTTRGAFPYPLAAEPNNPPADLQALANRVAETTALYGSGTTAQRPAASAANAGMIWRNTTTGRVELSTNSAWETVDPEDGYTASFLNDITAHLNDQDPHGTAGIADGAITTAKLADAGVTLAKLAVAVQNLLVPVGTTTWFTGEAANIPAGWLVEDGAEYESSAFPALGVLYGTGAGSKYGAAAAGRFRVRNMKGRVNVGVDTAVSIINAVGKTGGSRNAVVVQHNHTEQGAGGHAHSTGSAGSHSHGGGTGGTSVPHTHNTVIPRSNAVANGNLGGEVVTNNSNINNPIILQSGGTNEGTSHGHSIGADGGHSHTVDAAAAHTHTIDNAGVSGTDANMPPFMAAHSIVKAG